MRSKIEKNLANDPEPLHLKDKAKNLLGRIAVSVGLLTLAMIVLAGLDSLGRQLPR